MRLCGAALRGEVRILRTEALRNIFGGRAGVVRFLWSLGNCCNCVTLCGADLPGEVGSHMAGSVLWSYLSGFGDIICKLPFVVAASAFLEGIEQISGNAEAFGSFCAEPN